MLFNAPLVNTHNTSSTAMVHFGKHVLQHGTQIEHTSDLGSDTLFFIG